MSMLRLLADDLTGALDSAARFVPLVGPVPVVWSGEPPPGTMAMDSGTRDLDPREAAEAMRRLAGTLVGDIAFKKIDSLLRGHVVMELAACLPGFDHCVFAPAFPFQGRITRGGHQLVRDGNDWRDTGTDLSALPVRAWTNRLLVFRRGVAPSTRCALATEARRSQAVVQSVTSARRRCQ